MSSTTIRLRQKGYVRAAGYQAVNWSVTVPVSDPAGSERIGTDPLRFAPIFVVRNGGGFDNLQRVATLADLANTALPQAELRFFDVQGPNGDALYLNGPQAGDTLTFPGATLSGPLSYWLEDTAPYLSNVFTVKGTASRASGTLPQTLTGNRVQLSDYTFTTDDVNRWIVLSGFATTGYNGPAQILSVVGNTATLGKTISTLETGATWSFPIVEIEPVVSASLEPRYFPTRERTLAWELRRASTLITSATSGGMTLRSTEQDLVRSVRFTAVNATMEESLNLMAVIRNGAANLQREAALENTTFTALMTSTYGP